MKCVSSRVLVEVATVVFLLVGDLAQGEITTLFQWHLGDDDGVQSGDAAPATSAASIGGAGASLTRIGAGTSSTVINSTSAQLGVGFAGNSGGAAVPASSYTNTSIEINPTDVNKWGMDAVFKLTSAPNASQTILSVGGAPGQQIWNQSAWMTLQTLNGKWAVQHPGFATRTSSTAIDTLEHHFVLAGGELYLDGVQLTANGTAFDLPGAHIFGVDIGAFMFQGALRTGLNGSVSFARVFEYTGDFDINQLTVPESGLLLGDYDSNGVVDVRDYIVWRMDLDNNGGDPDGFEDWAENYGNSSDGASGNLLTAAVPEPSCGIVTLIIGLLFAANGARKR